MIRPRAANPQDRRGAPVAAKSAVGAKAARLALGLVMLLPGAPLLAAEASVEGKVLQVLTTGDGRFGGCMAALDVAISDASLDCSGNWVTFSCVGWHAEKEAAARVFESLRAAVVAGKSVEMRVTDGKKHGEYCHASRIKIQDEPHVDQDSDGDGVLDLEDDVPLDASETADTDDDGIGNNADTDDDNDGFSDDVDPHPLIPGIPPVPPVVRVDGTTLQDGSFTDSTGRTIRFRLHFRSHWDLSEPRGLVLYFHGNNTGSPLQMLNWFGEDPAALDLGLIHAAVASPNSYSGWGLSLNDDGVRGWNYIDTRLIHELLRSHFNGMAAIDHDRIVFKGGSQAPCFINHFLNTYGHSYGGGFFSWCGCLWPAGRANPWHPTIQWTPHMASAVSRRFRVFVQVTTEDFLFSEAVATRDLYHEVLGFETRWDLDGPGGHCALGLTPHSEILEWLSAPRWVPPVLAGRTGDYDGDGIEDHLDPDDDNDGALDAIDSLPREPMEWLDTDSDGIGNFLDRDADGDGVENPFDAFPLDPLESGDHDGDGIGDRLDLDDDNDGVRDTVDPQPLRGPRNDQLTFMLTPATSGPEPPNGYFGRPRSVPVHATRPAAVMYPEGTRQTYYFITLGDSANPVFEIMVDSLRNSERCENILVPDLCGSWSWRSDVRGEGIPPGLEDMFHPEWTHLIYVDRNQNRDLTDDGLPLVIADTGTYDLANSAPGNPVPGQMDPGTQLVLPVPYRTGERLPYGITMTILHDGKGGDPKLAWNVSSYWVGAVSVPGSDSVLIGTVDANLDGRFDSGAARVDTVFFAEAISDTSYGSGIKDVTNIENLRDYACIDLDRDGELEECDLFGTPDADDDEYSLIHEGDRFVLDGRSYSIEIAATGHRVFIR